MKIKLNEIKIGKRQRLDMGDISELADSMARLGQIHSIGVHPDGTLIWGMRRTLAAKELGWEDIEAVVREGLTESDAQEIELEEDIRRKNRTWQEECLAVSKLFRLKQRQARAAGETFGYRDMALYTGFGKTIVFNYISLIGAGLEVEPRDEALWACEQYTDAMQLLRGRQEKAVYDEMQRRNRNAQQAVAAQPLPNGGTITDGGIKNAVISLPSPVHKLNATPPRRLNLLDRAAAFNSAFPHLWNQQLICFTNPKDPTERYLLGHWFVGGGNISSLYGSYQIEYLKRITTLFPDIKGKQEIVHLFSGGIPLCDDYTVVGLIDNDNKPDITCDAHELSSGLGFSPSLIYADPPYSIEDSEHYANAMVNRERVISECAVVLKPGGFVVWIDQALPVFSSNELKLVGAISYIRSTGNRFRVVSIFQKPSTPSCQQPTTSQLATNITKSENPVAS